MNAIDKYFALFYNEEDCIFNFKKNDEVLTASGVRGKNYFEHQCHVLSHIGDDGTREHWAVQKIHDAFSYKYGDESAKNGSFEPSWFDDEYAISDYLEWYLRSNPTELLKWIKNRDINWKDSSNYRLAVDIPFKEVTGHAICAHCDYKDRFECHAVKIIFEYTLSHEAGEFAIYNAYPILTSEDRKVVESAKRNFSPKKHQK